MDHQQQTSYPTSLWLGALPGLIAALQTGSVRAQAFAQERLRRMAQEADLAAITRMGK